MKMQDLLLLPEYVLSDNYWKNEQPLLNHTLKLPYDPNALGIHKNSQINVSLSAIQPLIEQYSTNDLLSMHTLLTAALRILIFKYTQQEQLVFHCPILKKKDSQPFLPDQLLPISLHIKNTTTGKDFLVQEYEKQQLTYKHQHYPLDTYSTFPIKLIIAFEGLHKIHDAKSDLSFTFCYTTERELQYKLCYDKSKFSLNLIEGIITSYTHLLLQLLRNPEKSIRELTLLSDDNSIELLKRLNEGAKSIYPKDASVIDLFKEQLQFVPNEIAVFTPEKSFTYKQLDKFSDKIAVYLIETAGVKKGNFVGVFMNKSAYSIACFLGILKAGAAYLPLSPKHPYDRTKVIIQDAEVTSIISSKQLITSLKKLQTETNINSYLYVDSMNIDEDIKSFDRHNLKANQCPWVYVGERIQNNLKQSRWVNSETGKHIFRQEVKIYKDNILQKINPLINTSSRVLEIGCSAEVSLIDIAPQIAFYCGTNSFENTVKRNDLITTNLEIRNTKHVHIKTQDIDLLDETNFDLVIINNISLSFEEGHSIRALLNKIIPLLRHEAHIFLGDLVNKEIKETLEHTPPPKTSTIKNHLTPINETFFTHLCSDYQALQYAQCSKKIGYSEAIPQKNYSYDVLFSVKKSTHQHTPFSYDSSHLNNLDLNNLLLPKINASDLAYLMYTSGSTGTPKGVMIKHQSIVRLVKNSNFFPCKPSDQLLQAGPLEFDASTFEIWGALLNGLCCHIVNEDLLLNAENLYEYLYHHRVNVTCLTTAFFNLLADQKIETLHLFRILLVGGNKLSPTHVNKVLHKKPSELSICNGYGPTENTTFSTFHIIKQQYKKNIPIGKPISNSTVYVLDEEMNLLPIGAEGMLWVGGDGVSIGYLKREDLTKKRFIPNPYKKGDILYNTGDMAKINGNYEIEYLGRTDQQVKIRGHRIELGEIEHHIINLDGIKNVKVVVNEHLGDFQIIGYFISDQQFESSAITKKLLEKLPAYMVPTSMIEIDQFPLTTNGKVDINKLPLPNDIRGIDPISKVEDITRANV